jgi:hypothetical protein
MIRDEVHQLDGGLLCRVIRSVDVVSDGAMRGIAHIGQRQLATQVGSDSVSQIVSQHV